MKCENFLPFIDTYVDGEFDELESDELETHLSACPTCRKKVDAQINWKRSFKECLDGETVSADLKANILGQILTPTVHDIEDDTNVHPIRKKTFKKSAIAGLSIAAIALLSFYAVPKLVTVAPATSDTQPVVEQAIEWHRGNFPIEVTGPESNRIENWFVDKVAFPIHLPAFKNANLLGGRLANLKERQAAYVAYDIDGTRLSVMLFNGEGLLVATENIKHIKGRDIALLNQNGYTVALLQNEGVTYALTSDISEEKMTELLGSFSSPE